MKKSFQKLRSNIPSEIKLSRKYKFDVVFSENVGKSKNGRPHYGQTKFDPKVIEINKYLDDEPTVKTYWHEFLHTFRLYKDMHLSENQVKAFENKFDIFYQFFLTLHEGNGKVNDEET
jgi:hypothetical protein